MKLKNDRVLGIGSPIVDLLALTSDEFLWRIGGRKGGRELVDSPKMISYLEEINSPITRGIGGAASNTICAYTSLGGKGAFMGAIGNDGDGDFFYKTVGSIGADISRVKRVENASTARCLSLITPDCERTMRTDLGASIHITEQDVARTDFANFGLVHVEGFMFNQLNLLLELLKAAKQAGCAASVDLGSFEVVKAYRNEIKSVVAEFIDVVFANQEELAAFAESDDVGTGLDALSSICETAAVKLGADGSIIRDKTGDYIIEPVRVKCAADTTGAGDSWGGGFLYGYVNGLSVEKCGRIGSVVGAETVMHIGAVIPVPAWARVKKEVEKIVAE